MEIRIQEYIGRHQEYNFRPVEIKVSNEGLSFLDKAKTRDTAFLIAEELLRNPGRVDVISYWRCEQNIPEYQCWLRYRASVSDTDFARSVAGRWYPLDNGINSLSVAAAVYRKSSLHFSWKNSADAEAPEQGVKPEIGKALSLPDPDGDYITAPHHIDLIEHGGERDIIEAPFPGLYADAIKHHQPKTRISPPLGFFGPRLGVSDAFFRGFGENPFLVCESRAEMRRALLEKAQDMRKGGNPKTHREIYALNGYGDLWNTFDAFYKAYLRHDKDR